MSRPYSLIAFLWALVIFAGATLPVTTPEWMPFPQSDKLLHFIEYALLAFFIFKACAHLPERACSRRAAVITFLIGISYGTALELVQWFLPYRELSIADFAANYAGVLIMVIYCRGNSKSHE